MGEKPLTELSQPKNVCVNNTTTMEVSWRCTDMKRKHKALPPEFRINVKCLGDERVVRKKRKSDDSPSCYSRRQPQAKMSNTNCTSINKNSANSLLDQAVSCSMQGAEQKSTSCKDTAGPHNHARESPIFSKKKTKKKRKRKIPVTF